MEEYSTPLCLITSFFLSIFAYTSSQSNELPIQHLEFDEMIIEPSESMKRSIQIIEFDDHVIVSRSIALADKNEDDDEDDEDYGC
jgi:hypothetical protein